METIMRTYDEPESRDLTSLELDSVSGGSIAEDIYDAVTLVDMAVQWGVYGVSRLIRDPWA
jgi:hypothetical protein